MFACIRYLISIHAPREGSDMRSGMTIESSRISIHAPREGSDLLVYSITDFPPISIHAPREGSDPLEGLNELVILEFQSTLPVRGATWRSGIHQLQRAISIHAPREGSDSIFCKTTRCSFYFNPRSP